MTYNAHEYSVANGRPVRLYQFRRGVIRWFYCSAERDVTFDNQLYKSLAGGISDGGIRYTGNATADRLELTAPADLPVAQPWRTGLPSAEIGLVIYDMHYGDDEAVLSWSGRISSVNWPSVDRCKVTCISRDADLDDPGLTDGYTRLCGAVLGDVRCGVDLSSHRVETTIQFIDGAAIQSAVFGGYPDDWFTAGFIEWAIGSGEFDRRMIDKHTGTELQLLGGTYGLSANDAIRVYPGCDFLFSTCINKFSNGDRFRGIPNLEGRSPFDGNAVW